MKTQPKETVMETWVPALGASTAAVDMDAVLSTSVVAWLLSQLLPERNAADEHRERSEREPSKKERPGKSHLRRRRARELERVDKGTNPTTIAGIV